jgi:CRISPR system Cascade subunit CasB
MAWWARIADESASGQNKADRAVLKRCDSIEAVTRTAAYQRIYQAMRSQHEGEDWKPWQLDRLAMVVGLAAQVKRGGRTLAFEMNKRAAGSDRPVVSELRFRRLLESPDNDSLFVALRRVLPLVKDQLDLGHFACDLFTWSDSIKKRWAYDYYNPSSTPTDEVA